ncbi:MAG: hypothetical protein Q8O88_05980 [bacterium]|nr:hypothetical protein [bacterium]
MTIQQFIKKRPYLVWYVQDPAKLSNEAIVEAVLNYGDFDDVKKMIKILGIKKTAMIFNKKNRQPRNNFNPKISNYFKLFFEHYA